MPPTQVVPERIDPVTRIGDCSQLRLRDTQDTPELGVDPNAMRDRIRADLGVS
jgi:hypothetical protein